MYKTSQWQGTHLWGTVTNVCRFMFRNGLPKRRTSETAKENWKISLKKAVPMKRGWKQWDPFKIKMAGMRKVSKKLYRRVEIMLELYILEIITLKHLWSTVHLVLDLNRPLQLSYLAQTNVSFFDYMF